MVFADIISNIKFDSVVKSHELAVESKTEEDYTLAFEQAKKYNDALYQTTGYYVPELFENDGILSDTSYNNLLNFSNNGVMGSAEIPRINCKLPIYHGTSDEVLLNGIGHIQGSSLPIGGVNTRSLISGHTGMGSASLFTRIDELQEGDIFYIHVGNQTLAYRVFAIEIILPEEVDKLDIVPEKDIVSLITCTPYGVNTHRLIVNGQRVDMAEIEESMGLTIAVPRSLHEWAKYILPIIALIIYIRRVNSIKHEILKRERRKKHDSKKHEPMETSVDVISDDVVHGITKHNSC